MSLSFRLAWRDLKTHKATAILAMLLFALPIAGILSLGTAGNSATTQVREPLDRYSFVDMSMGTCGEDSLPQGYCIDGAQAHLQNMPAQERLALEFGEDTEFYPLLQTNGIELASDTNQVQGPLEAFAPPASDQENFPTPGEVALSTQMAFSLDIEEGEHVRVGEQELTVTSTSYTRGTLINAADLPDEEEANYVSWAALTPQLPDVQLGSGMWTTDSPSGRTDPRMLTTLGLLSGDDLVPMTLAGLMALLLMVAIVGPIFAVSARRQRRTMGLIAVSGGAPRILRRIMLWQALIVAVLGGVIGLIASIPVAASVLALFGFDEVRFLWPWDLALAGWLFAVACAVVAALQPALAAAREKPVLALAGGSTQRRLRFTPIMLIGPLIIVVGALGWIIAQGSLFLLVTGIGVLLSGSAVVWAFSKFSGRLPLAGRLAARDLMRQISRTAPGIAAIAGVVFVAAMALTLPNTTSTVGPASDVVMVSANQSSADIGRNIDLVEQVGEELGGSNLHREDVFTEQRSEVHIEAQSSVYANWQHLGIWEEIVISGPQILHSFPELSDEQQELAAAALEAGKGVVGTSGWGENINLSNGESLEVLALDTPQPFGLLLASDTATEVGITPVYAGSVLVPQAPLSNLVKARVAVSNGGIDTQLATVRVPGLDPNVVLFTLAPILLAFLISFGVVALIVYLSAAESRRDLRAIWAVGAQPGLLRTFTAAQGLIIATAGMLLGVVVGLVVSLPMIFDGGIGTHFVGQWLSVSMLVLALGLPLTGWLAGLLFGVVLNRQKQTV